MKILRSWSLVVVFAIVSGVYCTPETAEAQYFNGTIAPSMGGAGRAAIDSAEVMFLNPAGLSQLPKSLFGGHYFSSDHPTQGQQEEWGAVIADAGVDKFFPGAIAYSQRARRPFSGQAALDQYIHASVGGRIYPGVSLGISAHRQMTKVKNGPSYTQDNGDIGLLWALTPNIGVGAVAYDILSGKDSVPLEYRTVPTFAIGVQGSYGEQLSARFDIARPDKYNPGRHSVVMAGLETVIAEFAAFRLGGQWDDVAKETLLTVGLGWKGPRLQGNYSFQQDLREAGGVRHLIDLWLPF